MNNQWIAQVFVWENKDENGGEKLKESLLNTLDKLSFWLKVLALNLVEKTLLMK